MLSSCVIVIGLGLKLALNPCPPEKALENMVCKAEKPFPYSPYWVTCLDLASNEIVYNGKAYEVLET